MKYPTLQRVTEHVYWLPPADPDRPSLAAVVGSEQTLLLDIGASPAHTEQFLCQLEAAAVSAPDFAVLSHGHWDHIFGMSALEVPIFAHAGTAEQLEVLQSYDWSDEALDARVRSGEEAQMCARDIKLELPSPREVTLRAPDIVFTEGLELNLGDVTCRVQHVGGDHAADACTFHIAPDGLVFLGDCLYEAIYAPERYYTPEKIFPLFGAILGLGAEHHITGHGSEVLARRDLEAWAEQLQHAYVLASQPESKAANLDDELTYNIQLFRVGKMRKRENI